MGDEPGSEAGSVSAYPLAPDGAIPNNERCPLLAYHQALDPAAPDPAALFEDLFASNRWGGGWRNGVFPFHHFHSTAHEVLGVYAGSATILLGGERGVRVTVRAGDVVIIPAGVAHKRLAAHAGFAVVGAYPLGQEPDLCRGNTLGARRLAANVAAVPLPECDPVHGAHGPLFDHWR